MVVKKVGDKKVQTHIHMIVPREEIILQGDSIFSAYLLHDTDKNISDIVSVLRLIACPII